MNKNFQKYALVFLNIINNWLEFLTILMLNHELCRARRSRLDYIIYGKSMHYSSLPNNIINLTYSGKKYIFPTITLIDQWMKHQSHLLNKYRSLYIENAETQ